MLSDPFYSFASDVDSDCIGAILSRQSSQRVQADHGYQGSMRAIHGSPQNRTFFVDPNLSTPTILDPILCKTIVHVNSFLPQQSIGHTAWG